MARTTPELVKGIVEVDETAWPDISPFIDTANHLVTEVCGSAGYSDSRMELIERWLAAHFYRIADPMLSLETIDVLGARFQFKLGLRLQVTTYGQQVMFLDTKGGFAALNNSAEKLQKFQGTIGGFWLGTENEENDP